MSALTEQVISARAEKATETIRQATKMIFVTFQKEGIHQYLAAGHKDELTDVSFLQYRHRHIFHFKVWIEVNHADRDIEFILFKRWLESLYQDKILELNHKSCEMISNDLYSKIAIEYPGREVWIEVSEDNENGSYTQYTPRTYNY